MSEFNTSIDAMDAQFQLSDTELAQQALTRDIAAAEDKLRSAERHEEFTRKYVPTPPGPRPHPEAGGMDHQDWEVARAEYLAYDRDYEIDKAEEETIRAYQDLRELQHDLDLAGVGDVETVDRVAVAERQRLLKAIHEAKLARDRKEGQQFESATELYQLLGSLRELTDTDKLPSGAVGPRQWQHQKTYRSKYSAYLGDNSCESAYVKNPGKGPFKAFTDRLRVVSNPDKQELFFSYERLPESVRAVPEGLDCRRTTSKVPSLSLMVDANGRVTEQYLQFSTAHQQNASQSWNHITTRGYYGDSEQLPLSDEVIQAMNVRVAELIADMKSISSTVAN